MKITYIAHSGFLAELEHTILLFDYYQGEVPELPGDKKLYVFASHRHPDHFNPEIFQLAKDREQVWYVLSHDIWKSRVPEEWKARTVHLKPGTEWEHEGVGVQTLRSTDEGVAFLVQAEGKTLYHAGDAAFVPLDPRQEKNYALGLDYFLSLADPLAPLSGADKIYPMHCWDKYAVIDRWLAEHPDSPYRERIVRIRKRGEVFW